MTRRESRRWLCHVTDRECRGIGALIGALCGFKFIDQRVPIKRFSYQGLPNSIDHESMTVL
jgi:hypothetical protein